MKRIITVLLAVVLVCACLTACGKGISKKEAIAIALEDAGLERSQVHDVEAEREKKKGNDWYEVEFNDGPTEYSYAIDSITGEILAGKSEID